MPKYTPASPSHYTVPESRPRDTVFNGTPPRCIQGAVVKNGHRATAGHKYHTDHKRRLATEAIFNSAVAVPVINLVPNI